MKRNLSLVALLLVVTSVAWGQTNNVTGKFKTTWTPAGGKPNMILLADFGGVLNGTYTADSGEACPVTGTHASNKVNFRVSCSKFTIDMDGTISEDNSDEIKGTYSSPQFATGGFTMELQFCMLPEGCDKK